MARTDYATKADYLAGEFPTLLNQPITVKAAASKYNVGERTIRYWVTRFHYVSYIDPDARPFTINEAEVAYCARLYHERRQNKAPGAGGAPLLDGNGLPYDLKHPELAQQRREKRHNGDGDV